MSERVSLAALFVLALCVGSAGWFATVESVNHDATEIVKLIVAGLVGFMTGSSAEGLLDRMKKQDEAAAPPPEHLPTECTCGDDKPLPEPQFGRE